MSPSLSLLICAHSGDLGLGFGELGAVELRIPLSRVLDWFLKLKIGLCSRDLDSELDSLVFRVDESKDKKKILCFFFKSSLDLVGY